MGQAEEGTAYLLLLTVLYLEPPQPVEREQRSFEEATLEGGTTLALQRRRFLSEESVRTLVEQYEHRTSTQSIAQ